MTLENEIVAAPAKTGALSRLISADNKSSTYVLTNDKEARKLPVVTNRNNVGSCSVIILSLFEENQHAK